MNETTLLVDGTKFKDRSDRCYLAVFKNTDEKLKDYVYLGQLFFNDHYIVFDQSLTTEHEKFTN